MSEVGVKELKEGSVAVVKLVFLGIKELKDGFQYSDLLAIYASTKVDPEIKAGIEGLGKVPAELKDLDWKEGLEVGGAIFNEVLEGIKSLRK